MTTTANEVLAPVHDRMPVILDPDAYDRWLDPAVRKSDDLTALLRPYPAAAMTSHSVSLNVNKPTQDGAELITPLVNSA